VWKFNPDDTHIDAGETVRAINTGDEPHSFTEVINWEKACEGQGAWGEICATRHWYTYFFGTALPSTIHYPPSTSNDSSV
jgi:plastocyanin